MWVREGLVEGQTCHHHPTSTFPAPVESVAGGYENSNDILLPLPATEVPWESWWGADTPYLHSRNRIPSCIFRFPRMPSSKPGSLPSQGSHEEATFLPRQSGNQLKQERKFQLILPSTRKISNSRKKTINKCQKWSETLDYPKNVSVSNCKLSWNKWKTKPQLRNKIWRTKWKLYN